MFALGDGVSSMSALLTSPQALNPLRPDPISLASSGTPRLVPLGTLPGYIFHLNRLLGTGSPDPIAVHIAIATDPALAFQVLCLANAYLPAGFPPVLDLKSAINIIGMCEIRALVMNMPLLEYANAPANLISIQLFWQRSLFVAMMSRQLAFSSGLVSPEHAYSAG